MNDCDNCGRDLSGSELTLPWEDGDNPHAYLNCPRCGHDNTVFGFGEDD